MNFKFYQLADVNNKQISFNKDKLQNLSEILRNGLYLVSFQILEPKSSIKDYRACYFSKIDAIGMDVGETRYDLHELVKTEVISKLVKELPDLFGIVDDTLSTKYLNEQAWLVLLEALDLWAFTEYSIILK